MRPRDRRRAVRWIKYAGDIYNLSTLTEADHKARDVNKRRREMIKERKNENKRIEKEAARLLRENEKQVEKRYQPKH